MVTGFDPYTYTSGHWLRHDKLERDLRYIKFDFDALCRGLSRYVPERRRSQLARRRKEGSTGFFLIFTLDNNNARRVVVARLLFAIAGPPKLSTTSEVATIKYRE